MPITPISSSTFANKRFKRFDSYAFAARDVTVPLVVRELVRASVALPIGFCKIQDAVLPIAIQGFGDHKNLFVSPDGRWLGRYIPSAYRGYPFSLGSDSQGRAFLCFDDSSGLLAEGEGEPFFTEDGKPSAAITDVLNFLTQVAANRQETAKVCALLVEYGLLEPWPIKVSTQAGGTAYTLEGLLRINESKFGQLGAKEVYTLHQAGALPVIYCQLLSMQHLPALAKLAEAHQLAEQDQALPKNEAGELDLSFLADDTTISFEDFNDSQ